MNSLSIRDITEEGMEKNESSKMENNYCFGGYELVIIYRNSQAALVAYTGSEQICAHHH